MECGHLEKIEEKGGCGIFAQFERSVLESWLRIWR
jgi:hypothetical protein